MEKDLSRINELTGTATVLNAIFKPHGIGKIISSYMGLGFHASSGSILSFTDLNAAWEGFANKTAWKHRYVMKAIIPENNLKIPIIIHYP